MKEKVAYIKAILLVSAGRLIILLPDKALARLAAIMGFFAGLFSASSEIRETLQEVRIIFERSGEGSQIARRMLRVGSRRRIRMIARTVFL